MQKSMVVFTFSVLDWENFFWANLVQKIKIFSLSWTLVPRLIWICRIQWCCSLFLFQTKNTLLGQIWSKKSNMSVLAEIWYLDEFEFAEFNGSVILSNSRQHLSNHDVIADVKSKIIVSRLLTWFFCHLKSSELSK